MTGGLDGFDAAIVDLDGTMVDTLGDFVAALNGMLSDLVLPAVSPEVVRPMVGKGSGHLIRSVLQHAGVPIEPHYDEAYGRYQFHYGAVNGLHSAVFPGVVEGLQALQAKGVRLACLTNKPTAFAKSLLAAKGLDGYFVTVFGGDAFDRRKPDPLPVRKTCEALGSVPARTLMIGDSSNDAAAARAAGCPVVLVTYGYNHGEPLQGVDADGLFDSLAQVSSFRAARP
ncbi:MAG: phosphoglycolate phosphatase [Variovorax sp.]